MFLKSLVLLTLLTTALSCSCLQTSFKEKFCNANLVIRARVIARFDNCPGTCDPIADQGDGKITYIVRVARTFKGEAPEDDVLFLDTAVNSALCGVVLNVGTTYLFNLNAPFVPLGPPGAPVEMKSCPVDSLGVNLCDFPVPWKEVDEEQRRFLFRNSRNGNLACRD